MGLLDDVESALERGDFTELGRVLQRQQMPDTFRVLLAPRVVDVLAPQFGSKDIVSWIMRPRTWDIGSYKPGTNFTNGETLLHLLWQDLAGRLNRKMDVAFQKVGLPPTGAVLCFFDGAGLSIVVGYKRSLHGVLSFRPVAAVFRPYGVFELSHLLASGSQEQRRLIKSTALSVHKLLFQRGVLTHVDRQAEDDICGPSIDTVLLGEALAVWLEDQASDSRLIALEVGPGSGFLSALLAGAECVERLYAVDLNPSAIRCTLKNLYINGVSLNAITPRISVRAESFDANEFPGRFDLIVSNPPYLPLSPDHHQIDPGGYGLAVGGLRLCQDIIESLEEKLSPNGRLLLMTSSASIGEIRRLLPAGFRMIPVIEGDGFRVPLDVDSMWDELHPFL
jgi:release factor glutamine methyltransferase